MDFRKKYRVGSNGVALKNFRKLRRINKNFQSIPITSVNLLIVLRGGLNSLAAREYVQYSKTLLNIYV